jgi:hypothetical protein
VAEWLKTWLRRLGFGERRWIPDQEEREQHRAIVRSRLAEQALAESAADGESGEEELATHDAPPGALVIPETPAARATRGRRRRRRAR